MIPKIATKKHAKSGSNFPKFFATSIARDEGNDDCLGPKTGI